MKTTILSFFVLLPALLSSPQASAAPSEVFQAVLSSDALKRVADGQNDITNVRETAVYRCPGCFTIELTLGRGEAARKESFSTRMRFGNGERTYEVTHKEEQASAGHCLALGRVGGEDLACAQHKTQSACESKQKWEWCVWKKN